MSSNLRIIKVCAYCEQEFIAKKTSSQTCSDACAKRFYKVKQKEKSIRRVEVETVVKREPKAFITEGEIKARVRRASFQYSILRGFMTGKPFD